MTKRIRGWQLEKETGIKRNVKKEEPTSASQSGLVVTFVVLWPFVSCPCERVG